MKWRLITQKQLDKIIEERVASARMVDEENYEREIMLKQANLATLQSQINPHFLYNTLECIRGMALMEDKEDIADIAWSLSRFFRYSISGNSDMVSLQDELENVQNYAKIQNYRFQNRFVLRIEGEDSLGNSMLPKLTLQPVVENAILHGLKDMLEGGTVRIQIERLNEGDLRIIVSDNGCGMSPETLANLSQKILHGDVGKGERGRHAGIGMHNVDRRLKLHFGPQYGVAVYSFQGKGTDVELRIPYRPAQKEW